VATDPESRLAILSALTRKFDFDAQEGEDSKDRGEILREVESRAPRHLSGADFFSLCSSAMFAALKRTIDEVEASDDPGTEEENQEEEKYRIRVRLDDFLQLLNTLE